jgi:hypothetical protein
VGNLVYASIWSLKRNDFPLSCRLFSWERIGYDIGLCYNLQREDTRDFVHLTSKALEIIASDIFTNNGWRSNNNFFF